MYGSVVYMYSYTNCMHITSDRHLSIVASAGTGITVAKLRVKGAVEHRPRLSVGDEVKLRYINNNNNNNCNNNNNNNNNIANNSYDKIQMLTMCCHSRV
jgi:hypothetical protein